MLPQYIKLHVSNYNNLLQLKSTLDNDRAKKRAEKLMKISEAT